MYKSMNNAEKLIFENRLKELERVQKSLKRVQKSLKELKSLELDLLLEFYRESKKRGEYIQGETK